MNKKGFTLIELLAVIVILGLVLVIIVPNIIDIYETSKVRTEEIFVNELSESINEYIKINSNDISYTESLIGRKVDYDHQNGDLTYNEYDVTVDKGKISFDDIILSGIIDKSDFINAGNKNAVCISNEKYIEVYRDSDFVYCYKVPKDAIGCISNKYEIEGNYIINTCIWEPK